MVLLRLFVIFVSVLYLLFLQCYKYNIRGPYILIPRWYRIPIMLRPNEDHFQNIQALPRDHGVHYLSAQYEEVLLSFAIRLS